MDTTDACKRLHILLNGATELLQWPSNGLYFFQENAEIWGHDPNQNIPRLTRCGSHTKDGRLKARATEHFSQNSNGSVVIKHFGHALAKRSGNNADAHWGGSGSRHWSSCKVLVENTRTFLRNNVQEIIVGFSKDWTRAEKIAIGILSHCSLCRCSKTWGGQLAKNISISSGKIWNDADLGYVPTMDDMEWFFRNAKVAGKYARR